MSEDSLISIVMANYNGAAHLREAIESVQRQTFGSWELIVVDDASTDDSLALARRLAGKDPRIRVLPQGVNGGPAAARNRALEAARGDWIAIFDNDDVMLPDRLERLLLRARDDGALVIADNQLICTSDLVPQRQFIDDAHAAEMRSVTLPVFIDSSRLYSPRPDLGFLKPLIWRDLIERTGARYDESLRVGEDFHFLLKILAADVELHIEPEPLYLYRKHASSTSHRLSEAVIASMIRADRHARAVMREDPHAVKALTRRIEGLQSWAVHEQVMAAVKAGRWGRALIQFLGRPHSWALTTRPLRARLAAHLGGLGARLSVPPRPPRRLNVSAKGQV